jgi:hypothetical protein
MAIKTLADYQVIFHGAFTLDDTGNKNEKTLGFTVPSDFLFDSGSAKPILAFHASPIEETKFKVFVNHSEIFTWHLLKDVVKGMWSPFPANIPFPEGSSIPNPVPVRIIVSSGKIKFENVIIWYQTKINI